MKVCSTCGESLPLDEFYTDSRKRDGHQARCKGCWNDIRAARRGGTESVARRALRAQVTPGTTKVCFRCSRVLPLAAFLGYLHRSGGFVVPAALRASPATS